MAKRAHASPDQRQYQCLVCNSHHLGRDSNRVAEKTTETTSVLQQIRANGNGWLVGWLVDSWSTANYRDRVAWKCSPSRIEPIA